MFLKKHLPCALLTLLRFLQYHFACYNRFVMRLRIIALCTFLFLTFLLPQAVLSQAPSMTLYVGQGCPHCAAVEKFLAEKGFYDKCSITVKEIYFNRENAKELTQLFEEHNIPLLQRGVPTLLSGGRLYIGEDKIRDYLLNLKVEEENQSCEQPSLLLPALVAGALADSINPCEFAVLILLLTTILAASNAARALRAGLLFSLAIFLSYLSMGLGLYKALTFGTLPQVFTKVIAALAIGFGLLNLKDYFWYGKGGFVMEVPLSWRPRMKRFVTSVTSPLGAFFIGFLVSLFLLPCTSGPYIVVLGMLAQRTQFAEALGYLILYNLIFITPMVLLTLAVYKGLSPERAEEVRQKRLRLLHLIVGVILIGMGVVILGGGV
ncbi:hypothetical protein COT70_01115 [candidate division WWE3 bacterium CG09_land_8_20_14_0_10_47_33]|uniref:Uncharacterized protein n=1 Tax=candidate division WWE3 bacterium CG_4_9_14_0_2_um_filter_48_10 TaxID=1975078 RepID=A0A2M8EKL0_UNCKA|nr:MAG: hypothetical protein COT70_01115 [candidate division WWE3 bacterium CG09_land_8_20_14_0_10_47_33]PIZ41075.1 MAG: hypothetical protein COY35_01060 [candidate division WWE3 bacterium CG_4_10_14_0_2_um_filter_47_8]PJC23227.1 MAG: hypothetical protein CO059_00085 [candidate division WWE3 bacterium CG_4_9_14_0_2_um_filter_48_10]PJE52124.1 MAG: hypothetical protein COV28_01040 [candidate division WWE3 bacterium CG10_big_fil_rev_8_21_14_0_10_48_23]